MKKRIENSLYIQPEDESDMDTLVMLNSSTSPLMQDLKVDVDMESLTITEILSQKSKEEKPQGVAPVPEMEDAAKAKTKAKAKAKAGDGEEEKEVPHAVEPEKGDFDSQVMKALQDTPWNARAKAPDDFFLAYSDTTICIPVFLLYLFIIVITKTMGALFSN